MHQGHASQGGGLHGELPLGQQAAGGLAVRQGAVLLRQPPTYSELPFLSFFELSSFLPSLFCATWPVGFGQNPLLHPPAGTSGPTRKFLADRAESDVDDPDLGAAALEDDTEGGGGPWPGASLEYRPDDDEEVAPRPRPGASHPGAGSSAAPGSPGCGKKRRAVPTLFGSRPKKPMGSAAATRRDEAAAKANRFRKEVKKPPLVSA